MTALLIAWIYYSLWCLRDDWTPSDYRANYLPALANTETLQVVEVDGVQVVRYSPK